MCLSRVSLPVALLLLGCGSTSGPSAPTYQTTVAATSVRHDRAGNYLRDVTVHVTLRGGAAVPGLNVSVQSTGGDVAPLPLVSDAAGNAMLTWTIPVALTTAGHTYALGFCAHAAGAQCSIDLSGDEVVHAAF